MSILDVAHSGIRRLSRDLVEDAGPGTTAGITVIALVGDPQFAMPLVAGPSDEHLAGFDAFGRRVMAQTLRALADRWDPSA